MKFQIEYLSKDARRPCLVARQMEPGQFSVSERSCLAGVSIKPFISQPRALTPEGKPDLTVFVFTLRSANDLSGLAVGQTVELHVDVMNKDASSDNRMEK